MNPLKSRGLIPKVAEDKDLPQKLVEDIVNFYWKEVWNNLTNPTDIKIHIAALGDFNIKHWRLEKEIEKYNKFPKFNRVGGKKGEKIEGKLLDKSRILSNLLYKVREENQRKEFIYNHKKSEKEVIRNLEE